MYSCKELGASQKKYCQTFMGWFIGKKEMGKVNNVKV
jgi:hypothetical protein